MRRAATVLLLLIAACLAPRSIETAPLVPPPLAPTRVEPSKVEDSYPAPVVECAAVARKSCHVLSMPIDREEVRDDRAEIRARTNAATPVRIELTREETSATHARFEVGTSDTPANRRTLFQLKAVFDALFYRP
jgi:hypothetical protein